VSRPRVVIKEIGGVPNEPYEILAVDIEDSSQGAVMTALAAAAATAGHAPGRQGRVRLDYVIPARGLIGSRPSSARRLRLGLLFHVFDHYAPVLDKPIAARQNGVMISNAQGTVLGYSLFNLQERGRLMVAHGDEVYEGRSSAFHSRDNDLVVNPLKGKKLTTSRGRRDENIVLTRRCATPSSRRWSSSRTTARRDHALVDRLRKRRSRNRTASAPRGSRLVRRLRQASQPGRLDATSVSSAATGCGALM